MGKKADWTFCRLRRETRLRLEQFCGRLEMAYEMGKLELPQRHNVKVTVDDAVNFLLQRDEDHIARGKKAREKQKRARHQATTSEATVDE